MARKVTNKMSRAVSQLEHIYNVMNVDFFENKLPTPIITVQSSPRSYGHCTVNKVWKRKEDNTYELNISAETLNCPIEETLDTMLHEMIHLYCRENGIKECSRGSTYHNKKFKELAEKVGLDVYYTGDKHGWNTKGGDKLIEYALSKDWSEIVIGRESFLNIGSIVLPDGTRSTPTTATGTGGKKPSSTRKYICPCCGNSVRATKDVRIACLDCNKEMIKEA